MDQLAKRTISYLPVQAVPQDRAQRLICRSAHGIVGRLGHDRRLFAIEIPLHRGHSLLFAIDSGEAIAPQQLTCRSWKRVCGESAVLFGRRFEALLLEGIPAGVDG